MKRNFLEFSYLIESRQFQKVLILITLCFVLVTGSGSTAFAERHEGHHRSPEWRYSRMPARGTYINRIPRAAYQINYGENYYHYRNGMFYRPYNSGFVIAAPPFGLRIGILPRGYLSFNIGGFPYFYYGGTYYTQRGNEYEVVSPPIGAVVESIPRGYEKVEIRGHTYYIADGVQYKPILRDGEIWYEVIKSPNR